MPGEAWIDGLESKARGAICENGVERGQATQQHRSLGGRDRRLAGAVRLCWERVVVLVDDDSRQAGKRGEPLQQIVVIDREVVERLREPGGGRAVVALWRYQAQFHELGPVHFVRADTDNNYLHGGHRFESRE